MLSTRGAARQRASSTCNSLTDCQEESSSTELQKIPKYRDRPLEFVQSMSAPSQCRCFECGAQFERDTLRPVYRGSHSHHCDLPLQPGLLREMRFEEKKHDANFSKHYQTKNFVNTSRCGVAGRRTSPLRNATAATVWQLTPSRQ